MAKLLKDARADYPSSHVEVVPADAPFVPPRADVAKAIALVRDRPSDLGYASWRLAILRALGEEP